MKDDFDKAIDKALAIVQGNKKVDESMNRLKYLFVGMMGCLLILVVIFAHNILYQQRVDEIFEQYEQEMSVIHGDTNER